MPTRSCRRRPGKGTGSKTISRLIGTGHNVFVDASVELTAIGAPINVGVANASGGASYTHRIATSGPRGDQ